MKDFVFHVKLAMDTDAPPGMDTGMAVLAHAEEEETAKNLRYSPKWHKLVMKVFSRLDKNGDSELVEWEFTSMVSEQDAELVAAGRELFHMFAPDGSMTRKEFLRFVCVTVLPESGFKWHSGDMVVMEPKHPRERAQVMKLFSIFDPPSDGMVSPGEFEEGYMGKLLWKLREEELETSGLMYSSDEFEYGKKNFNDYAKAGTVDLVGFVKLTEACKKEALLKGWKQQQMPNNAGGSATFSSAQKVGGGATLSLALLLLAVMAA